MLGKSGSACRYETSYLQIKSLKSSKAGQNITLLTARVSHTLYNLLINLILRNHLERVEMPTAIK